MPEDAVELFVQIADDFIDRPGGARGGQQPFEEAWRNDPVSHRPSSCDSIPFHNASSAARELRRAARPDALTV